MHYSKIAAALFLPAFAMPALAADTPELIKIRYDNSVLCAAYAYSSADFIAGKDGEDAAADEYMAAETLADDAKAFGKQLSKQPEDVGVEIDKMLAKMVHDANGLSDADYDAWDLKISTHCIDVYDYGPELDKPFAP